MIKLNNSNNMLTKTEENERKKEWKRKLMLILAPISRFATALRPFSSSSFFFFHLLQWRFERVFASYPMNPHTFWARYILPLKAKTSSNRSIIAWKTKSCRKTEVNGGGGRPPRPWQPPRAVVVTTVEPWWPLAVTASSCPVRCVLSFLPWFADCLSWAICFGLFGLVCFLSSLGLMSNHIIFTNSS